jgi:hypothetical protein
MPLYEVADRGLRHHEAGTFKALGLYERADLQRLLRDDIAALADDLLAFLLIIAMGVLAPLADGSHCARRRQLAADRCRFTGG